MKRLLLVLLALTPLASTASLPSGWERDGLKGNVKTVSVKRYDLSNEQNGEPLLLSHYITRYASNGACLGLELVGNGEPSYRMESRTLSATTIEERYYTYNQPLERVVTTYLLGQTLRVEVYDENNELRLVRTESVGPADSLRRTNVRIRTANGDEQVGLVVERYDEQGRQLEYATDCDGSYGFYFERAAVVAADEHGNWTKRYMDIYEGSSGFDHFDGWMAYVREQLEAKKEHGFVEVRELQYY